jgi:hypothetical protein
MGVSIVFNVFVNDPIMLSGIYLSHNIHIYYIRYNNNIVVSRRLFTYNYGLYTRIYMCVCV